MIALLYGGMVLIECQLFKVKHMSTDLKLNRLYTLETTTSYNLSLNDWALDHPNLQWRQRWLSRVIDPVAIEKYSSS